MPAHASKCIHPSLDRIFRSPSLRLANSCLPQRTLSLPAAGCEFTRSRATKLVPYSGSSSCTTHGLLLVGGLQSSHRPAGKQPLRCLRKESVAHCPLLSARGYERQQTLRHWRSSRARRSEERRVGKECRSRRSTDHQKKNKVKLRE